MVQGKEKYNYDDLNPPSFEDEEAGLLDNVNTTAVWWIHSEFNEKLRETEKVNEINDIK